MAMTCRNHEWGPPRRPVICGPFVMFTEITLSFSGSGAKAHYGVNSGIGRSGKVLRRVVGLPDNSRGTTDQVLNAVAKREPKRSL